MANWIVWGLFLGAAAAQAQWSGQYEELTAGVHFVHRERGASRQGDYQSRMEQLTAQYDFQLRSLQERLNNLSRARSGDRNNDSYYSAEASNIRSEMSRIRSSKSVQISNLRNEYNRYMESVRWKYKGRLAGVNGQTIPEWAQQYRVIDGVLEFSPRIDPRTADSFVARHRADMEHRYAQIAAEEQSIIDGIKREWVDGWLARIKARSEKWYQDRRGEIEKEPEPIVKERSMAELESYHRRIQNFISEQESKITGEISARESTLTKMKHFFDAGLREGYTPDHLANDARYAIAADKSRRDQVFDSVFLEWQGGRQGGGGFEASWGEWDKEDLLGDFVAGQRALFAPFDEKRTWLNQRLAAIQTTWVAKAEQLNAKLLETIRSLQTDAKLPEGEVQELLAFHARCVNRVDDMKRKSAADLDRLMAELMATHGKDKSIESVWGKIESDWKRGEMVVNEEWRVFCSSLEREIEETSRQEISVEQLK